jgi:uncharacterized protein YhfF
VNASTARIEPFWSRFSIDWGRSPAAPYEVFAFGDSETLATELAALVRRGVKTATASLAWEFEAEGKRPPRPGDLSIVTRWDGEPLCIIETTDVRVEAFEDVSAEFAAAEGEGDRSLAFWREAHWAYFGRI